MKISTQKSALLPKVPRLENPELQKYLEDLSAMIAFQQRNVRSDLDLIVPDPQNCIHEKVISIGNWDMDATPSVNVAHGLTLSKIKRVSASIIRDDSALTTELLSAGSISWDATNIILGRTAAGLFDSTDYNTASFNRGYVIVGYID